MHGCGGEIWKSSRHMWSVPTSAVDGDSVVSSSADSFFKGARKISVGECALFKPAQELPPFIGIIHWLKFKGEHLHLGVNWLYRPAEVKLGKGILLDAAPNEVFYSFHKDEIPAASLLHPCKVAFLPKGTELSQGTPSFVCRRVYDIAKERLWWLTDRNYIDKRQEEVDKLLFRTQKEMHATVQSGGRSPKPVNGPMVSSQLKVGSDSVQNSASSFSSHNKRRKRDHNDQGSEPGKRERSSKTVDGDSVQFKTEYTLKSDIANITEKGGLVNIEGVEKLLQLMQPDKTERKLDLISRSILAGVIAMTDKFDCLSRFVQLKGLSVFDEWLQDIHKGKIGDSHSSKEGDKSVEEFLLALLRALDKLPVNLHALQTCNIGRSVNHLRTQKSVDIQRRARGLVDTWKKRVEAEMNIIDSKSGTALRRNPGGSSDTVPKNSDVQVSASKSTSLKPFQGDSGTKSASSSPGAMKSSALSQGSGKDGQLRISVGSASDLPSTPVREEKSSSSSQSHNYSQSLSGREDARSSTAGSMCVNKISGSTSRHRKSSNGFPGPTVATAQKETGSNRTVSLRRGSSSERASGLTCEKAVDVPAVETRNHKLIVKIPNHVRSPAQSASGGLSDDPSIMNSRVSSPVLSDKPEQFDQNMKEKNEACRANVTSDVNTESWQSNDLKDMLTGSDEGDVSPPAIRDENRSKAVDDTRKSAEVVKAASSTSGNELKSGNLQEASFNSINALIESCVKFSEGNTSMTVGDDVGMNLLASVAAGEISKSDLVSPADSPQRLLGNSSAGNESNSRSFAGDTHQSASANVTDVVRQGVNSAISECKGELPSSRLADDSTEERKPAASSTQEVQTAAQGKLSSFGVASGTSGKDERKGDASVTLSPVSETVKVRDVKVSNQPEEKAAAISRLRGSGVLLADNKAHGVLANMDEDEKRTLEVQTSHSSFEQSDNKRVVKDGFNNGAHFEQKQFAAIMKTKDADCMDKVAMHSFGTGKDLFDEDHGELNVGNDGMESHVSINQSGGPIQDTKDTHITETRESACVGSGVTDQKSECTREDVGSKEAHDECSAEVVSHKASPAFPSQEKDRQVILAGVKPTGIAIESKEERACTTAYTSNSTVGTSVVDAKPKFDLNEGFDVEDGIFGETSNLASIADSSAHTVSPLPFPVSGVSSGLPASITVTAAAKGAFVPREDLLRSRRELGWKGSAATSAFRPAEPRKSLEMPLGLRSLPLPDVIGNRNERPVFDFDLNVADEGTSTEESALGTVLSSALKINNDFGRKEQPSSILGRASGGFDLDLNLVDDANEVGHSQLTGSKYSLEPSLLPGKSTSSSGFPNREIRRDFDLNNGPGLDDCSEAASLNQHGRGSVQFQLPVGGIRMNSAELGNFSAWFHPGSSYSPVPVPVPSIFHDRGDKPFPIVANQRIVGPPSGCTPDIYRGSVLSSSPALPFPSTPFQYPVFPFGSTFPVASANLSGVPTPYMETSSGGRISYPGINSQLLGHAASSHAQRPYMVGLPDVGSSGGTENSRKSGRQGLDLNAGPGGLDMERKDEVLPLASRQFMVAGSQAISEEQARMHQLVGGVLKRKEPEGSWDAENFRYRQSPWQ